jgi:hypothetical protein
MAADDWQSEPDPREDAFRLLLTNIANEIIDPKELETLRFLAGEDRPEVKSALNVFQLMLRKGKFSSANVQPLKKILEGIERCDLVSGILENYIHRQHYWDAQTGDILTEFCSNLSQGWIQGGSAPL